MNDMCNFQEEKRAQMPRYKQKNVAGPGALSTSTSGMNMGGGPSMMGGGPSMMGGGPSMMSGQSQMRPGPGGQMMQGGGPRGMSMPPGTAGCRPLLL